MLQSANRYADLITLQTKRKIHVLYHDLMKSARKIYLKENASKQKNSQRTN